MKLLRGTSSIRGKFESGPVLSQIVAVVYASAAKAPVAKQMALIVMRKDRPRLIPRMSHLLHRLIDQRRRMEKT
jgi:hypothetical protein